MRGSAHLGIDGHAEEGQYDAGRVLALCGRRASAEDREALPDELDGLRGAHPKGETFERLAVTVVAVATSSGFGIRLAGR